MNDLKRIGGWSAILFGIAVVVAFGLEIPTFVAMPADAMQIENSAGRLAVVDGMAPAQRTMLALGFGFETITIQNDGSGEATCVSSSDPCDPPELFSGISISSDGFISGPPESNVASDMVMGAGKDIIISLYRDNNLGNEFQAFGAWVKKAASYSMADLAGTWYSMKINTPQKGFSNPDYFGFDFDTMTLQSDGTGTITCIASSDPCNPPEAFSGVSISADGIITAPLNPDEAHDMVMGENKDIMVRIFRDNSVGNEEQAFTIFVKKAD